MPSSDEMFGTMGGAGLPGTLGEMLGPAPSRPTMPPRPPTDTFMRPPAGPMPGVAARGVPGEPTPEDMEKAANDVRFSKTVRIKDIHVRTYDLNKPEDVKEYRKTYLEIYAGIARAKFMVVTNEKIHIPCLKNPRWVVHMEWVEYDLEVTDHTMKRKPEPQMENNNA